MNHKEVEHIFCRLYKNLSRPMLDFESENIQLDISKLEFFYENLVKEYALLKKQLQYESNRHEYYKHEYYAECDLREYLEDELKLNKKDDII